ncbi:MAG: hypothetical protein DRR11_16400 [Gammaproteobacteria bacterium]|nr:MAG: hypothetical protein DRR11_16400 [Gammaproteobacteria bacterium]
MLKSSVDRAGFYSDALSADAFYHTLNEEIRAAQDAGDLGQRRLVFFQLDPVWRRWLPDFFNSLGRVLAQCAYPSNIVIPYASGSGESFDELTILYNDTVGRTLEEPEFLVDRVQLSGWAFKRFDRLLGFVIRDPSGQDLYTFSEFFERAEVRRILSQFEPQLDCGIDLEFEFDSLDARDLSIVFESLDDRPGVIPLSQFLRQGSGHVSQGLKSRIEYHIDELEIQGAGSGEYLAPTLASRRIYFAGIIATIVTSLGFAFRRRKFPSLNTPALAWAILLIAWFLGRLALNSIVDATLFQCKPRDAFATLTIAPWVVISVSALWAKRTNSSFSNEKKIQQHSS